MNDRQAINAIKDFLNEGSHLSPKKFFNDNFSPDIIKNNWEQILGDKF